MEQKTPSPVVSPARQKGATVALVLLCVFLAAIVVCTVVGATESVEDRHAMTAVHAAMREAGSDAFPERYGVLVLPLPEEQDASTTYPVAEVVYGFAGGVECYAIIDNTGVPAVSDEVPDSLAALALPGGGWDLPMQNVGGLFRFRTLFENGVIAGVVLPDGFSVGLAVLLPVVVCMVLGYLLGGINSGVLISRRVYGGNIRKTGSGNPGATNMLRTYGVKAAVMTLLGDVFKVLLAMFVASFLFGAHYAVGFCGNGLIWFTGLFGMIGHIFPPYARFRGGKGVSAACALALYTAPIVAGILILVFVALVALTRYVSVGSMLAGMLYPVVQNGAFRFVGIGADPLTTVTTILVAILVVFCHRKNISRLMQGTENKISFRKKKKENE